MTPTEQDKELREQVSKVIDGWRYEQDWVASKAEDFPEHKGAGCGCPVCVKMSALNSQATNELIALITADRKRVALEARIAERKQIAIYNYAGYTFSEKTNWAEEFQKFIDNNESRIAQLSNPQEEKL